MNIGVISDKKYKKIALNSLMTRLKTISNSIQIIDNLYDINTLSIDILFIAGINIEFFENIFKQFSIIFSTTTPTIILFGLLENSVSQTIIDEMQLKSTSFTTMLLKDDDKLELNKTIFNSNLKETTFNVHNNSEVLCEMKIPIGKSLYGKSIIVNISPLNSVIILACGCLLELAHFDVKLEDQSTLLKILIEYAMKYSSKRNIESLEKDITALDSYNINSSLILLSFSYLGRSKSTYDELESTYKLLVNHFPWFTPCFSEELHDYIQEGVLKKTGEDISIINGSIIHEVMNKHFKILKYVGS